MAATGGTIVLKDQKVEDLANHAEENTLKDPDEFYSYQLGKKGWNLLVRKRSEQDIKPKRPKDDFD